jgi:hypothetical protein
MALTGPGAGWLHGKREATGGATGHRRVRPQGPEQGRSWAKNQEHHLPRDVAFDRRCRKVLPALMNEGAMARRQQGRIVETPTEARQGEPGPSVLALLTVSTGLAVLILGVIWFAFFRI